MYSLQPVPVKDIQLWLITKRKLKTLRSLKSIMIQSGSLGRMVQKLHYFLNQRLLLLKGVVLTAKVKTMLEEPNFTTYAPPPHMLNVDLDVKGGLGFLELPYKRLGHPSSSTNFNDLQVGMNFSPKDAFVATLKWYSIKHEVNFHVRKSRAKKIRRSAQCITIDVHGKSWHL
ncbi:hypothetical protein PVK06_020675 [Gossypium arboreum]|uniref:Uncharacterized protein n=1 Tax=Gossypium arboreum TaxID=29729 RepID=A0ABR0PNB0_GOSAR|nr:hypothetical protein PVK06_020675 [Gossypium arboreum]